MELSTLSKSVFRFGQAGHAIPAVGFGTYLLKGETGLVALKHAIKTGYRLLDTAHLYQNEELVGQAVRESIAEGVVKREEMWITSKLASVWMDPAKIGKVVQHQHDTLGVGAIDLYLIHCPWGHEFITPEEETAFGIRPLYDGDKPVQKSFPLASIWAALEECVDKGLVKHIGVSNFDNEQVQQILDSCRIRPANNQVELHPWIDQSELVDFHHKNDVSVTSFMSLGRAQRSEKHGGNLLENEFLSEMASKYGVSIAQLLLRYQLQRGVLVIPKSKTPDRIDENSKLFHFEITNEDMAGIKKLDKNTRSCNFVINRDNENFPNSWKKEQFYLDATKSA